MRASAWLLVLVACDRPAPLVICHNANCERVDVSRDDTLPALAASLALTEGGKPTLDGVEIDTLWDGAEARCLFAHDFKGDVSTAASAAADVIAEHLASSVEPGRSVPFNVFIELKGYVSDSYYDQHDSAQRIAHADCALDAATTISAGAAVQGHALTIGFVSSSPVLVADLTERPTFAALAAIHDVILVGDIFAPYSSVVPDIASYRVKLDAMLVHPSYTTVQHQETCLSLGFDLVHWAFTTNSETLDAIKRWEPRYVLTSEAELLRRWIDN